MMLLKTVSPEEATDKIADAYRIFPPQVPVPQPLVMMSASPELAYLQSRIIHYYQTQSGLDGELLSLIRYLVASRHEYAFCINFNSGLLQKAAGFSKEELEAIKADPSTAPLDEPQKALLLFVLKAVKTPQAVTSEDIEALHKLGWSDQNIFDAAYHGASMVGPSILYKAFVR